MTSDAPATLRGIFWEFFKISLFVVGGGYAIAAVAEDVFGRKLKWLREGEILDHLPIVSSIPGLIAGNIAIYTGMRLKGRVGGLVALVGVALPSLLMFLGVSMLLAHIPKDISCLNGALLGLRSALTGVVAGTIWRTISRGPLDWSKGVGVELTPLSGKDKAFVCLLLAAVLGVAAACSWKTLVIFLGFGCICIGGGFPIVPFYMLVFVGANAWAIGMPAEDFSNLIGFTQATPGPVGVNAATYFGYRLGGIVGAVIATAALLTPSYLLMTAVLIGLNRWRQSRVVRLIVGALRPIAIGLMLVACWNFGKMSIVQVVDGMIVFSPAALVLAVVCAVLLVRRRMSIMMMIALSAAFGAVFNLVCQVFKFSPLILAN